MSALCLRADVSQTTKGMTLDTQGLLLPLSRLQRQDAVSGADPQASLLGSASSEVGTQDTQIQWLSTVLSHQLTCRPWF